MTLKELSQAYYIRKEIAVAEEELAELRLRATSSVGLSRREAHGSNPAVSDKVGFYAASIVDLERDLIRKRDELIAAEKRIHRYIDSIDDSRLRLIFRLRFLSGRSWISIAHHLGGGNTQAGVKMMCYRHIAKTS